MGYYIGRDKEGVNANINNNAQTNQGNNYMMQNYISYLKQMQTMAQNNGQQQQQTNVNANSTQQQDINVSSLSVSSKPQGDPNIQNLLSIWDSNEHFTFKYEPLDNLTQNKLLVNNNKFN